MKRTQITMALMILFSGAAFAEGSPAKLDQAMKQQIKVGDKSAASQKKISTLASTEKEMFEEYKSLQKQIESTKIYNQQMKEMLTSQETEMVSMKNQIEDLKNTNKEILPLMEKMSGTLEKFVSLDVPFLPEERKDRVETLKGLITKSNVSTSEKFRRILEAYQIENEYGRTIEAYRSNKMQNGQETTVEFLRVGRIGFYYQTLDRSQTFAWSREKEKWVELDGGAADQVLKGIKMAQKQMTPNLISLPIEKTEASL